MKKGKLSLKFSLITLGIIVILMAIFNVIIFVNPNIIGATDDVFWTTWSFAFPISLLLIGGCILWNLKAKEDVIYRFPLLYFLIIYQVLQLICSCIFFFVPKVPIAACVTVEIIITLLFIAAALYVYGASSFVGHNEKVVKAKVTYIRDLEVILNTYKSNIDDPEIKKSVEHLAESIRFSDPMSDESLADVESEIKNNVNKIATAIKNKQFDEIEELVKSTETALELRNSLCKAHK